VISARRRALFEKQAKYFVWECGWDLYSVALGFVWACGISQGQAVAEANELAKAFKLKNRKKP
jgi:hypothetical protein